MRFAVCVVVFAFFYGVVGFELANSLAIGVWTYFLVTFLEQLNHSIAFKEYIVLMYGLNYLFSPAFAFEVQSKYLLYAMRLSPENYFSIAIPAMLCLYFGLSLVKTNVFTYDLLSRKGNTTAIENLLKIWVVVGFILGLVYRALPGELSFVGYLLSSIRYVGAFGLFILDRKKYKWFLYGLLALEIGRALASAMFHDMVVWILFFGMVWTYIEKPKPVTKLVLGALTIFLLFLLQSVKSSYRETLRVGGEGGLNTFSALVSKRSTDDGGVFNADNISNSLVRANQGWIFSSTMQATDRKKNFQDFKLLKIYAESAFLPRFLAPNKLDAGDNKIFNQFSGVRVTKGTSMGLGLFADGYISFGYFGTLAFAFVFGLLCGFVFKVVEKWASWSPLFVFFVFPLLNYAVRADCETQTWMGHMVKGLAVYAVLMYFTKSYLRRKSAEADTEPEADLSYYPNSDSITHPPTQLQPA